MSLNVFFLEPRFWPVLLGVPLVWFVMVRVEHHRSRNLASRIGPRAESLVHGGGIALSRQKRSLVAGATLFLSVALMQPTWGDSEINAEARGLDLMICLDVSKSMLAQDSDGARLSQAKDDAAACIARVGNGRIGLIVYAGEARLLSPLTRDHEAVLQLLRETDIAYVFRGGTNSNKAIALAYKALEQSDSGRAGIFLLSDGEDQEISDTVEYPVVPDLPIYCVGYGTLGGAKIPLETETGTIFLSDGSGRDVVSALDDKSLQDRASSTHGAYVAQEHRRNPLVFLLRTYLLPRLDQSLRKVVQEGRSNRYQWPLLLAILLLSIEMMISGRPRK